MPPNKQYYGVVILDCDGVLLDSNDLKILAMEKALQSIGINTESTQACLDYFRKNFGKSRFHHVDRFVSDFIESTIPKSTLKDAILEKYAGLCESSYKVAPVISGVEALLSEHTNVRFYVASGSEEKQLNDVLRSKGLSKYFQSILGSPATKAELLLKVVKAELNAKVLMVGDAFSDYYAAKEAGVDFIFFRPFSNVVGELSKLCNQNNLPIVDSMEELGSHL